MTYLGYEPPKATFFEQKATSLAETDNSFASEFGQMKKTMSQMNNELTHLRFLQGQSNNFQRNNVGPYNNNNYNQNYNRNFVRNKNTRNNNNVGNNNG